MSPPLNIATYIPSTHMHGRGPRFALWVQGCLLQCPGCCNTWMNTFQGANVIDVKDMVGIILRSTNGRDATTGMTLMGGEPTLQAPQLAELIHSVRVQIPNYTVITFTGYRLWKLRRDNKPGVLDLLKKTDVLIDGPFNQRLPDAELIRGSRNQYIHHLTSRLGTEDLLRSHNSEIHITPTGIIKTGFTPQEM